MRRRVHGGEHASVARALHNLALAKHRAGDLGAATELYREALDLRRRVLQPDHIDVARSAAALGELLYERGADAEAKPLLSLALEIRTTRLGEDHVDTAETKSALGACLTSANRFAEAEPLLLEGYAVLQQARGSRTDTSIRRTLRSLIELYEATGRPDRASVYRDRLGDRTVEG